MIADPNNEKWLSGISIAEIAMVPFLKELFEIASEYRNRQLPRASTHDRTPQIGVRIDQAEFESILEVIGSDRLSRSDTRSVWTKYLACEGHLYLIHFCQGTRDI